MPASQDGIAHLRRDTEFRPLIQSVGTIELKRHKPYFFFLCRAILAQQVSTAAAQTITRRFRELYPDSRFPQPERVMETPSDVLRSAGVSRQKARYLRSLGEAFAEGALSRTRFSRLDDDQVIDRLTEVTGIGRWTAEMFLMFCLARPDVLPLDDLGIRRGMETYFDVSELDDMRERAEPWRPYRTLASMYLWRAQDAGGVD